MSFFKIYKLKKSIYSIIYLPVMEYHVRWALSIQILLRSKKITLLTLKCWGCRFYWRRHSLLPYNRHGFCYSLHWCCYSQITIEEGMMLLILHEENSKFRKNKQYFFISTSKDNTGYPLWDSFFRQMYTVDGFTRSVKHSCSHLVTIKYLVSLRMCKKEKRERLRSITQNILK